VGGLIPLLIWSLGVLLGAPTAQGTTPAPRPPRKTMEQQRLLRALDRALALPSPLDRSARFRIWRIARLLEHVADPRVGRAWERLTEGGRDRDRANLLLFHRRERPDVPLGVEADPLPGPETTVELSLAWWGQRRFRECAALLRRAVSTWPEEARFRDNLAWLEMRLPNARAAAGGDERAAALTALILRGPSP